MARFLPEPPAFIRNIRDSVDLEREQGRTNPYLAAALEREKLEGHRIAVWARTIALGLIMVLLPFLNPEWNVLFYEAILLLLIALGWLQLRVSSVGVNRWELVLIYLDLLIMTVVMVMPNPFLAEDIPTAVTYRFDNFIYFFVILAVATLAYSWRTVVIVGAWTTATWMLAFVGVYFFGHTIPVLSDNARVAFDGYPLVLDLFDPNSAELGHRLQEVVVFSIVAAILGLKGWRSNQLMMRQAEASEERANLSRYFPSNMVDMLASKQHDVGAVRSQDVAVLFTDIVGFTEYAERHSPQEVMDFLRDYHAIVERAIFENNGTLDKYLGDGVMATFGTPETGPDDAANAMKAAKQVMRDTQKFNTNGEGKASSIKVSVGVHFGPVIIGDIGPSRRLEFAVLGDTVNVASRLEAATRELGCTCVVSNDLVARLQTSDPNDDGSPSGFEEREKIQLRGRANPVDVWVA